MTTEELFKSIQDKVNREIDQLQDNRYETKAIAAMSHILDKLK